MSTPTLESPITLDKPPESELGGTPSWRVPAAAAVLAPPVMALAALLFHMLLPNKHLDPVKQTPLTTYAYPVLLQILFAITLLLAAVQWAWRPLQAWARYNGPLFAGAIFMLAFWDLLTLKWDRFHLPYFPGPDMVLQGMIDDRAQLFTSTLHTLGRLLAGYSTGVISGVSTGVLLGWFRILRYWGLPVVKLIGPIPATAFIPLAMLLFTNAFSTVASLIALAVWFPVTMLTFSGIVNVPVSYLNVARTLGAGRWYLIFRVALPSALPSIFVGLFMGLVVSFLTLMAAETAGVAEGIGWYINMRRGFMDYHNVNGALVIIAAFCSGLMTLLFKVRDRILGWQKGMIRW